MNEIGMMLPDLTQYRIRAREQMLNALSPDSIRLLSEVVGQLGVAARPDVSEVAAELDRALSADEKRHIMQAATEFDGQVQNALSELKRTLFQSGQDVSFGSDDSINIARASAGMALLMVCIEQLVSSVHKAKYNRPK